MRLTPTLFDKLTADFQVDPDGEDGVSAARLGSEIRGGGGVVPASSRMDPARLERFSEQAVKGAVRRELSWLFNTNHLASSQDLSEAPEVRTSVLNYGVPDLAGKPGNRRLLAQRAKALRDAILNYEPRLDPRTLHVDIVQANDHENAVTFMVKGDVIGAVQALMVQYRTDVEMDSGVATVKG